MTSMTHKMDFSATGLMVDVDVIGSSLFRSYLNNQWVELQAIRAMFWRSSPIRTMQKNGFIALNVWFKLPENCF